MSSGILRAPDRTWLIPEADQLLLLHLFSVIIYPYVYMSICICSYIPEPRDTTMNKMEGGDSLLEETE